MAYRTGKQCEQFAVERDRITRGGQFLEDLDKVKCISDSEQKFGFCGQTIHEICGASGETLLNDIVPLKLCCHHNDWQRPIPLANRFTQSEANLFVRLTRIIEETQIQNDERGSRIP